MKLEPPGLPTRLVDINEEVLSPTLQTTWDVLASTAIDLEYACYQYSHRVRVRWLRFSIMHWCCWRPMRIGKCEYQPKSKTFGWTRAPGKFAACRECGRIDGDLV